LHREGAPDPTTPLPGSTDVPALIDSFTNAGADVRATIDADLAALPATVGLAAYRILQEALTNAVKHAAADNVEVVVAEEDGMLRIRVADDGRGFDTAGSTGGFGLAGMRERVGLLGGEIEIASSAAGTVVTAALPSLPA
jgi:signal transduction histidine kinase